MRGREAECNTSCIALCLVQYLDIAPEKHSSDYPLNYSLNHPLILRIVTKVINKVLLEQIPGGC